MSMDPTYHMDTMVHDKWFNGYEVATDMCFFFINGSVP